jgi:hypothetical protein
MRVDATVVQLRPRPMFEAADLGVRLVQAHAGALLRGAAPVYGPLVLVAFALLPLAPWAPFALLFVAKPWLDRTLLFVLARSLFRQPCGFAELWAARREIWWRGLLASVTRRRLSPWRSFTQPALQLEGLAGAASAKRRRQLRSGHQGAALAMTAAFWQVEQSITIGVPLLFIWLVPGGEMGQAFEWADAAGATAVQALLFAGQALAVALVEPFFVGAGFAMYLNRRVELEAWDVEQALRHAFPAR